MDEAIMSAFSQAVRDGDGRTRCFAAKALGDMGIRTAAGRLIDLLSDSDPDVRCDAAASLGRIRDRSAVGALITALEDEDGMVRVCAVRSLVEINDTSCVEAIEKMMLRCDGFVFHADGDLTGNYRWEIMEAAAWALGELGEAKSVKMTSELLDNEDCDIMIGTVLVSLVKLGGFERASGYLRGPDPAIRRIASKAFVHSKDYEAIGYLKEALVDDDSMVRANAVTAIGRAGSKEEMILLAVMLKDRDPDVRVKALEAIIRLCGRKAVNYAVPLLGDSDCEVRKKAVEALGSLGDPQTAGHLRALLSNPDEDETVLSSAVEALGRSGDPAVAVPIISIMLDKNRGLSLRSSAEFALFKFKEKVCLDAFCAVVADIKEEKCIRLAALQGVCGYDEDKSVERFKAILDSTDELAKVGIAKALRYFKHAESSELLETLLGDGSRAVQKQAALSLAWKNNDAGIEFIPSMIDSGKDECFKEIFAAIGNLTSEKAREIICGAFRSASPVLRCSAAIAAGQSGNNEFSGALLELLDDEMENVRREAISSLGMIGDGSAVEKLVNALYGFENFGRLRGEIARSLMRMDRKKAMELLLDKLMNDKQAASHWVAIEAISTIYCGNRNGELS